MLLRQARRKTGAFQHLATDNVTIDDKKQHFHTFSIVRKFPAGHGQHFMRPVRLGLIRLDPYVVRIESLEFPIERLRP